MKFFFLIIIVAFTACNDTGNAKVASADSSVIGPTESRSEDTTPAGNSNITVKDAESDTLITVKFPKDSTWTKIQGKMRGINHPVTVLIPVEQGKRLTAKLQTEDTGANIRINQIFTPDGKADGPFGKELSYTIKQQGTYKLIIAENMMQGDEWKGTFVLTVAVD